MLIGLHGQKQVGKDTTYSIIKKIGKRNGQTYTRVSFAENLKKLAGLAMGVENPVEWSEKIKVEGIITWSDNPKFSQFLSGREYLQNIGSYARELFGEDFWLNQALPKNYNKSYTIVTDVRYENEAKRIRDLGGYIIYIERGDRNSDTPATEQKLPDSMIDFYLDNNGTLEALELNIKKLLYGIEYEHNEEYEENFEYSNAQSKWDEE